MYASKRRTSVSPHVPTLAIALFATPFADPCIRLSVNSSPTCDVKCHSDNNLTHSGLLLAKAPILRLDALAFRRIAPTKTSVQPFYSGAPWPLRSSVILEWTDLIHSCRHARLPLLEHIWNGLPSARSMYAHRFISKTQTLIETQDVQFCPQNSWFLKNRVLRAITPRVRPRSKTGISADTHYYCERFYVLRNVRAQYRYRPSLSHFALVSVHPCPPLQNNRIRRTTVPARRNVGPFYRETLPVVHSMKEHGSIIVRVQFWTIFTWSRVGRYRKTKAFMKWKNSIDVTFDFRSTIGQRIGPSRLATLYATISWGIMMVQEPRLLFFTRNCAVKY